MMSQSKTLLQEILGSIFPTRLYYRRLKCKISATPSKASKRNNNE